MLWEIFFCSLKHFVSFGSETYLLERLEGSAFLQVSHHVELRFNLHRFIPPLFARIVFGPIEKCRHFSNEEANLDETDVWRRWTVVFEKDSVLYCPVCKLMENNCFGSQWNLKRVTQSVASLRDRPPSTPPQSAGH